MNKEDKDTLEVEGVIKKLYPNAFFKVKLDIGEDILCHLCGKMRKKYIKLTAGDRVRVEISKYDPEKGRIVYRLSGTTYYKRKNKPHWKK